MTEVRKEVVDETTLAWCSVLQHGAVQWCEGLPGALGCNAALGSVV